MSSLTLPSAVAKVQDVVNAIIDGRYHDLDTWTATSAPIKQRIRAFSDEYHLQQTTGVGQEQQQHDLQLLTRALLATWSQTAVGGGKFGAESNIFPCYQEQDKVEEEKHILQWFEVTRNKKSNSLSSSSHYNHLTTTPSMDYYDTSLVFQRTLDYSGTEMKTSRVQALVPLTTGQQGAVQLRFYPGVLLVSEGEEEEESTWKFHGVVCLPAGSEKNLISEGWSCMQGGAAIAPQPTAIGYTGIGIQGIQEQQLQCKAPAIKHRVEEDDDDSDDDYWGQYGEADSNHEEGKSSGSGSGVDATACSLSESGVSYPSSSSASSDMALSSSTYHHPSSVAVETSTTTAAATTVFGNAFSRDFSSGSHPNNCRWDGVNEEDDDSDDEYWGKYGDCDEDESEPEEKQRHPQGQELLDEQGQGSEVYPVTTTMSKDSSHASKAERQKIDPLVPTAQQEAHLDSSEQKTTALLDSAFPSLLAPIPIHAPLQVLEPGQVDPTALSLRLLNLIAYHSDPTGFSTAGQQKINHSHLSDENEDLDGTQQQHVNETSTDDSNSDSERGFLIRLDSRFQYYHDAVTPIHDRSEHLVIDDDGHPHTNYNSSHDCVPLDILNDEEDDNNASQINKEEEGAIQAPRTLSPAPELSSASSPYNNNNTNTGSTALSFPTHSSQSRFQSQKSLSATTISSTTTIPHQSPQSTHHHQQQLHQQDESISPSNSCTDSAFQESLESLSDSTTTPKDNINNVFEASTGPVDCEQSERDHFLRSLRSMTLEAKTILGLSKADLLNILDQAYDSPSSSSLSVVDH